MAENLCPKCKNTNRMSARFCATCGAPLLAGVTGSAPIPSDTVPLPSGTILQGRYRVEGLLGKGGFGAVYRAWDLSLSRQCAVKENLDTSAEAQRQFAREATVLAGLNHPNLPRVTDHYIISGQGQYLVMDYVEGEDLISLVEKHGLPPLDQTLEWMGQVMDALVYLHGRQPPVVHRDIKPANIRITPDSRAMLVDFGLVKASDPHTKTTLGARAVTPGYSPPEQYGQGHTDSRSDIYSLGATLYALLTGQDPPESVLRIGQDIIKPVESLNPQINPAIGRVIVRAMALSPAQRYQTVANLKSDLNAALAAGPVFVAAPPAEPPAYEPTVAMGSAPYVATPSAPVSSGQEFRTTDQTVAAASSIPAPTVAASRPVPAGVEPPAAPLSTPVDGGLRVISDRLVPPVSTPVNGEAYRPASAPVETPKKRNWLPVAGGIILVGIVLAVVILAVFWNWLDQSSQDEIQLTVSAAVDATRTAWAESTSGAYLPDAPQSTPQFASQSASQPASLSHALFAPLLIGSAGDSRDYLPSCVGDPCRNGDLCRTPVPESLTLP